MTVLSGKLARNTQGEAVFAVLYALNHMLGIRTGLHLVLISICISYKALSIYLIFENNSTQRSFCYLFDRTCFDWLDNHRSLDVRSHN